MPTSINPIYQATKKAYALETALGVNKRIIREIIAQGAAAIPNARGKDMPSASKTCPIFRPKLVFWKTQGTENTNKESL